MKSLFNASILAVILISLMKPAFAADSDFQQGMSFYTQKNFDAASRCFMKSWTAQPDRATAAYYAGFCLYQAGRRPEAIKVLWQVVDKYPGTNEATQARNMLKRIDSNYASHKVSSAPATPQGTQTRKSTASPRQIVDSIVTVNRPRGKIPAVTPAFTEKIKELLVALPMPVLQTLEKHGGKVTIMPSVVEHDYRIQNEKPRGWEEGSSWQDSPALTWGREVIVSQYRRDRSGEIVETSSEVGVIRHEVGHALDYCLGEFSKGEQFAHAYLLDAAKVPGDLRGKLDYYLQTGGAGASEVFAELFNEKYGGYTDRSRAGSSALVKAHFPLCDQLVNRKLGELQ